jgi:hypothetical protein
MKAAKAVNGVILTSVSNGVHTEEGQTPKVCYPNGEVYEGNLTNNLKNGKGIYKYKDGSSYEGDWRDDQREGEGKLTDTQGNIYQGNFQADKKNGKGKFITLDNKYLYEGDWLNDHKSGNGVETSNDGTVYTGEFFNGKRHGKGNEGNNIKENWHCLEVLSMKVNFPMG